MRFVVTPEEMAALDSYTIHTIGVPGAALMERAALAVADEAARRWPGAPVLVACGPGNNGGDGLAAARILHMRGARVCCFAPFVEGYQSDALTQRNAARGAGVRFLKDFREFQEKTGEACVLIDALFGTGLKKELTGEWAEIVDCINLADKPVLAVDIPSGIDGGSGRALGRAVKAACTVTFQYPKVGHLLYPGRDHAGALVVADIGIAQNKALFKPRRLLQAGDAAFPPRSRNSHKGNYGHVAVVAGSLGMLGAGALASRAAVRGGAGLVTWLVPQSLIVAASCLVTEAMILPVPDEGGALTAEKSADAVLEALKGKSAAVIGPGLSRNPATGELIRNILHRIDIPIVLDADGLFAVSGYPGVLQSEERVLTPHPGEMARLLGCETGEVEADALGAVLRCSQRYGGTAVLKGSTTLIASGEDVAFSLAGNPGMATGGSGDVLAGLTGALLAQGIQAFEAACGASRLHGLAGDIAAEEKGQAGMAAGDIVECLPMAEEGERRIGT